MLIPPFDFQGPLLDLLGIKAPAHLIGLRSEGLDHPTKAWLDHLASLGEPSLSVFLPIFGLNESSQSESNNWLSIIDHVNLSTENPILKSFSQKSIRFFSVSALYIPSPNLPQVVVTGLNRDTRPKTETRSKLESLGLNYWSDRLVPLAIYAAFLKLKLRAYGYFSQNGLK